MRYWNPSSAVKQSGLPKDSAVNQVRWSTWAGDVFGEHLAQHGIVQRPVVEELLQAV
jgi:hypothetical protein